jgi:tetratricopeptide (TPR) repeat protein
MTNLSDYTGLQQQAAEHLRAGDMDAAIKTLTQLTQPLLAIDPQTLIHQAGMAELLEDTGQQLIDLLRWQGAYSQAIDLHRGLARSLPWQEDAQQMGEAQLMIESGQEEAGLDLLRKLVEVYPDSFWIRLSQGTGYLWLQNYEAAEEALQSAAKMSHTRKIDRAMAYRYLVDVYALQEQTDKALAAWREASRLDSNLRAALLPSICRMLISANKFDEAARHISQEKVKVRQLFYQGLLAFTRQSPHAASQYWKPVVVDHLPLALKEGQDEYAESCIRLLNPGSAVMALEPLVQAGLIHYYRMVLLGLAWAQRRDLERAHWYLERSLRLGDLDRPRRTQPAADGQSAAHGRFLDHQARLLYENIAMDKDSRQVIDLYFFPQPNDKS